MNKLVPINAARAVAAATEVVVPAAITDAGEHAVRRFLEFFAATIRNRNTRTAYYRACCSFFAWLEQHGIAELPDIEPIHVAAYIEALQATVAKPTVKQHLAAGISPAKAAAITSRHHCSRICPSIGSVMVSRTRAIS